VPQNKIWSWIGQSFAIVASILLAFAIQAWWEGIQEREYAERMLASVLEEYRNNIGAVQRASSHRYAVRDAINKLFEFSATQETPEPEVVDDLLGALMWAHSPDANWSALDTMIGGGQLVLIENAELRNRLAAIHKSKGTFEVTRTVDFEHMIDVVFPYFREHALLPQIAVSRSALYLPGGNGEPVYEHSFELGLTRNHVELLRDGVFLGILMEKLWIQLDAINRNELFLAQTESTIDLLEAELGDS